MTAEAKSSSSTSIEDVSSIEDSMFSLLDTPVSDEDSSDSLEAKKELKKYSNWLFKKQQKFYVDKYSKFSIQIYLAMRWTDQISATDSRCPTARKREKVDHQKGVEANYQVGHKTKMKPVWCKMVDTSLMLRTL
ncbi:unnamed protein product, partial [Brenthis ino]